MPRWTGKKLMERWRSGALAELWRSSSDKLALDSLNLGALFSRSLSGPLLRLQIVVFNATQKISKMLFKASLIQDVRKKVPTTI
jgi:hypothetical protein